jgi:hypothetical protein
MSLVDDIFDRVVFDELDCAIQKESYGAVKQIAQVMDEAAPDCDEKMIALRSLHAAVMYFGVALSKQEKYKIV